VISDEIFPPKNAIALTCSYHRAGSLVPPFRSHTSTSFFSFLSCFLLTFVCPILLSWVMCYKAFCLHVVSSFCCIPVFCPELELHLFLLQSLCSFHNLSRRVLLFSHIYFISAVVILLASLVLMTHFSLPYNEAG